MKITAVTDTHITATQSSHIKQGIQALLDLGTDSVEFKSKKLHYLLAKTEVASQYKVTVSYWKTDFFGHRVQDVSKIIVAAA
jgi:hypothetical protein